MAASMLDALFDGCAGVIVVRFYDTAWTARLAVQRVSLRAEDWWLNVIRANMSCVVFTFMGARAYRGSSGRPGHRRPRHGPFFPCWSAAGGLQPKSWVGASFLPQPGGIVRAAI